MARPQEIDHAEVVRLHAEGVGTMEIARRLNCAHSSINYIVGKPEEQGGAAVAVEDATPENPATVLEIPAPAPAKPERRFTLVRGSRVFRQIRVPKGEPDSRRMAAWTESELHAAGFNAGALLAQGQAVEIQPKATAHAAPVDRVPAETEGVPKVATPSDRFRFLENLNPDMVRLKAQCGETILRRELHLAGYGDAKTPIIAALIQQRQLVCETESAPEFEINPASVEDTVRAFFEILDFDGSPGPTVRLALQARNDLQQIPGRALCPERDETFTREIERQLKALIPGFGEAAVEAIGPMAVHSKSKPDRDFALSVLRAFIATNRIRSAELQALAVELARSTYDDQVRVGVAMLAACTSLSCLGHRALFSIASRALPTPDKASAVNFQQHLREAQELRDAAQDALFNWTRSMAAK